jgi:hypothetical protein
VHRVSSSFFSESESEGDMLANCKENKEKMALQEEAGIGDGCFASFVTNKDNEASPSRCSSCSFKNNNHVVIEIINMNKDKPHTVRRTIHRETPSVSEWINDNIIIQNGNILKEYRPPSVHEMTTVKESNSKLKLIQQHEFIVQELLILKSKSCCALG